MKMRLSKMGIRKFPKKNDKPDTIVEVLTTSPTRVSFKFDLLGPL
jgi:hypothetical protein